jgi:HSP20 family protein
MTEWSRQRRRVGCDWSKEVNKKEVAMNVVRWEPFEAFEGAFNRFPSLLARLPRFDFEKAKLNEWWPAVDISETPTEYLIRADLPAVKKEDLNVTFDDGMLTITGDRKQKEEQQDEKFHRVETYYGHFERSFALPATIDAAAIRAETKDGLLTVHVPKIAVEAKKPTNIKIQ